MKKAMITRNGETLAIEAPEDKEMVFDAGLLQHGILSLGEYGTSGHKVAVFREWDYATFEAPGYTIKVENPF